MSEQTDARRRVSRQCPLCGTDGGTPWLTKPELRIVRCRECSMLFANPVPEPYVAGTFYTHLADFYLSEDKLTSDYARARFARELRLFRKYCPCGSVLDVGCSTGGFLHQLQTLYPGEYTVLGTDVAGPALDYAESRGVPVTRASLLTAEFGEGRYDAVTFWAVLEHLDEPRAFLAEAAARIKPGGHCFVLVPNMNSLAVRVLGARYRYLMPEHLNYFTRSTLRRLLAREKSFQIVQLSSMHFNPVVILQDWRGRGQVPAPGERGRLLRRTTAWKQQPWLRPVKVAYDLVERALGSCYLADNLVAVLRRR